MNAKSKIVYVVLFGLCGFVFSGCPDDDLACTEMGCGDSLQILISMDDQGAFDEGTYQVEFFLEEGVADTLSCDTSDDTGCHMLDGEFAGYFEGNVLQVTYNVAWGEEPPSSFSMNVTFDGQELGSADFSPEWNTFYPNGEECDEYPCHQAPEETVEIIHPTI